MLPSPLKILTVLDRRLRRARAGSVLIIVIVLLLLLAILGAAYLSTTRSDRIASAQSVLSTNVDIMLDGIAKVCEGVIVDDLNDTAGNLYGITGLAKNTVATRTLYQGEGQGMAGAPPTTPTVAAYNIGDIVNTTDTPNLFYYYYNTGAGNTFPVTNNITPTLLAANGTLANGWQLLQGHLPFTATGSDPWLASRIPSQDNSVPPNAIWPFITQSVQVTTVGGAVTMLPASILGTPFEDPTYPSRNSGVANVSTVITSSLGAPLVGRNTALGPLYPTHMKLASGQYVPALAYTSAPGATAVFAAADADGDGIADSLLFRIPGMNLDGLTWFAGVRIIDNNSAINANTAWSRDLDTFNGQTAPASAPYFDNFWSLFPTSVGLRELANPSDETGTPPQFTTLNTYRFNGTTGNQTPYDESANGATVPPAANARTDFNYVSNSDAFYNEFVRRINNPGYNNYTALSPTTGRYQAFPLSDEASLAYHFCLQNQNTFQQAVIESCLANSLCGTAANPTPPYTSYGPTNSSQPQYDPSGVQAWYAANFAYPLSVSPDNLALPLRALLVTRNPVSNYIQQLYQGSLGTDSEPLLEPSAGGGLGFMLPYGNVTNVHFKGVWTATPTAAYVPGDIVLYPGVANGGSPNGPNFTYMAIATPGTTPPVSGGVVNYQNWVLQPWSQSPVKANVNTATFEELFRAFWCAMAGNPPNSTPFGVTPSDPTNNVYDNSPTTQYQFEFRSPLRDPTSNLPTKATQLDPSTTGTNTNTMLLRAALAAVNTLGLRDNSQNVISRTIYLNAFVAGSAQPVEARVYSCAPNPIISEVYANTYADANDPNGKAQGLSNPKGYVAIELFNPYNVPLVLHNWQVGYVTRLSLGGTYPNLLFAPITGITAIGPMAPMNNVMPTGSAYASDTTDVVIPPQGYALLENYNPSGKSFAGVTANPNDALYRSASSGLSATGVWTGPTNVTTNVNANNTVDVWVTGLSNVIADSVGGGGGSSLGGEFYLLRPRRADGTFTSSTDPLNNFSETGVGGVVNLYDLVPVDSYDFSNLLQTGPGASTYNLWSYIRSKGALTGQAPLLFKGTYPGYYNPIAIQRFTGTVAPQGLVTPPTMTVPTVTPAFGQYSTACYADNFPPIQVYPVGATANMHFPNAVITQGTTPLAPPTATAPPLKFPFGGFARNGDMLDIPFVGSYRIRLTSAIAATPQEFVELNSLPIDCAMAAIDDGKPAASTIDTAENIGRFMPMRASQYYNSQIAAGGFAAPIPPDFYSWTRNLFNYLTVESDSDAYLPNADPNIMDVTAPTNQSLSGYTTKYGFNTGGTAPTQVYTRDATASDQLTQDNVGIDGLININTASWKILSMLPMITPQMETAAGNPANQYITDNQALAQQIVLYRDGDGTAANPPHGPFTSIFDLNNVVAAAAAGPVNGLNPKGFQNGWGTFDPTASNTNSTMGPTSQLGLLSPADANFGTETPLATSNGIAEDYQSDCLVLTRISNLITTRSDTFTIYIVVQGWENAGSTSASLPPQPMVTRRYAFIVDRSAINGDPGSRFLKTLVVPND